MDKNVDITLKVNGQQVSARVTARTNLVDFIRYHMELTGSHIGCEHGVCGACTILVDGEAVRSCLMFAVQADALSITTVEGITPEAGLSALQAAFRRHHALQCGFAPPGSSWRQRRC